MFCKDCSALLTKEERHYYEDRCEECERAWADRIGAWQRGGKDEEFDALYNEPFG